MALSTRIVEGQVRKADTQGGRRARAPSSPSSSQSCCVLPECRMRAMMASPSGQPPPTPEPRGEELWEARELWDRRLLAACAAAPSPTGSGGAIDGALLMLPCTLCPHLEVIKEDRNINASLPCKRLCRQAHVTQEHV